MLMQTLLYPCFHSVEIKSDNFSEARTAKCPFKSGRRGTTSDNAQKTHPRRHRGCWCFRYIHPPPICTVSCNRTCLLRTSYSIFNRALKLINLLKNLKSAKFQFEACTTMLEYVCMYDYYTKKWLNGAQYIPLNNSYYFNVYWINSCNQQTCWMFHVQKRG